MIDFLFYSEKTVGEVSTSFTVFNVKRHFYRNFELISYLMGHMKTLEAWSKYDYKLLRSNEYISYKQNKSPARQLAKYLSF